MRTETKIEYILPPQEWLAECENPSVSAMTNEGLLRGYFERGTALQECNARMVRLIDWRNEYKTEGGDG